MTNARLRFAPSPTGSLHVGGARTALFNFLLARKFGGKFVLRIEDSDAERNTTEATDDFLTNLRWLSLDWDEGPEVGGDHGPYFQSQRTTVHDLYFQKLEDKGVLYEDEGAIRFRCPNTDRTIDDIFHGSVSFRDRSEPDMTIRRADGSYIFHFVNVVDDITMDITHVLRGDDHLANTPRHLDLLEALGATPPQYGHMPLILNPDGSKMGKRDAGASVTEYREAGFAPEGVTNYLALLGWAPENDREMFTLEELIDAFDTDRLNQSNARFQMDKCEWLSGQHIHAMAPETLREKVTPFLEAAGIPSAPESLSDAILAEAAEKTRKFSDLPQWLSFLFQDDYEVDASAMEKLRAKDNVPELVRTLIASLKSAETWDDEAIGASLKEAAKAAGVKKGALMFPCRVGVSGQSGGLGLYTILRTLGKDRSIERLTALTETLS